jgi:hypothetical protein
MPARLFMLLSQSSRAKPPSPPSVRRNAPRALRSSHVTRGGNGWGRALTIA